MLKVEIFDPLTDDMLEELMVPPQLQDQGSILKLKFDVLKLR
jgi:hypothetical protein